MSKLGLHWMRNHPDLFDPEHIEAMQYKSVKLFEWHWNNRDACREMLAVLPRDSYILARDHPLSEQKGDMWADPVGTGTRHANEWAEKVRQGNVHTPLDRTFFLGINEPDATNGDRNAIDLYTATFLDRLKVHGLRGGAFNFSTGHPRTVDGSGSTLADYSVFERSHQAIVRGRHIGVLHIYGTANAPCAPGHYDRLKACPWQDVEWVVGECGADEHVVGGGNHDGYLISMSDNPARYCAWLDELIIGINDPRIHSYQVFTYDFSHPWSSFNVREIRHALEGYQWRHTQQSTPPATIHLPAIEAPQPTPAPSGIIDPLVAQAILEVESGGRTHGADGRIVIRFEAHIFKSQLGNDALWAQHFRTDSARPWVDQMWRRAEGDTWQMLHTGRQADEWAAFEFAQGIQAEAAAKSISMGAAQIMGFNHARIGYPSATAMFLAFADAQAQTIGFINFCLSDPALMDAMRRKDWRTIAAKYNGTGAIVTYAPLLEQAYRRLGGA